MKELQKIKIGERVYPIKIDLNVLEVLQKEYGSVHAFEMEIVGLKYEDGEGGEKHLRSVEPSIKAISTVLPLMINEGLEIEAAHTGQPYEPVDKQLLIEECDTSFQELAKVIHEEFKRCFVKK